MNELVRVAICGVALAAILIVFADMEGSDHEPATHSDPVDLSLGDLVFLEPLRVEDPMAGLWVLRSSEVRGVVVRDRWPEPSIDVPASLGVLAINRATHYGPAFEGKPLGCTGAPYRGADPTIAAIGAELVPCGAALEVCGPGGCAIVIRVDTCPGCGPTLIDLSEAAHALVCGPGGGTCEVMVRGGAQ